MEETLVNLFLISVFLSFQLFDISLAQSYPGNIALYKVARQSGVWVGRQASCAVDGDTDTSNLQKCALAADCCEYNWWQVDLGGMYVVTSVTFFVSASSTEGTYLMNSDVFVGNNNVDVTSQSKCWSFGSTTGIPSSGGSGTFNCSKLIVGRYITVRKKVISHALSICEFMATGNAIGSPVSGNVAYLLPASQLRNFGGNDNGRFARYAVDGSFDTTNLDRCACSDDNSRYNWWQVDLTTVYAITAVTIYAPTASSGQNEYYNVRYSNISIGNDNTPDNVVNEPVCVSIGADGVTPGGRQTFNCSEWLIGRYVTIRKTIPDQMLTICEVDITAYTIIGVTLTTSATTTSAITGTSKTTTSTTRESSDRTSSIIVEVILGCILLISIILNVIFLICRRRGMQSQVNTQSTLSTSSASQVKGSAENLPSKAPNHKDRRPVVESDYADIMVEPGSSYAQLSDHPAQDTFSYTALQQTSAAR